MWNMTHLTDCNETQRKQMLHTICLFDSHQEHRSNKCSFQRWQLHTRRTFKGLFQDVASVTVDFVIPGLGCTIKEGRWFFRQAGAKLDSKWLQAQTNTPCRPLGRIVLRVAKGGPPQPELQQQLQYQWASTTPLPPHRDSQGMHKRRGPQGRGLRARTANTLRPWPSLYSPTVTPDPTSHPPALGEMNATSGECTAAPRIVGSAWSSPGTKGNPVLSSVSSQPTRRHSPALQTLHDNKKSLQRNRQTCAGLAWKDQAQSNCFHRKT